MHLILSPFTNGLYQVDLTNVKFSGKQSRPISSLISAQRWERLEETQEKLLHKARGLAILVDSLQQLVSGEAPSVSAECDPLLSDIDALLKSARVVTSVPAPVVSHIPATTATTGLTDAPVETPAGLRSMFCRSPSG